MFGFWVLAISSLIACVALSFTSLSPEWALRALVLGLVSLSVAGIGAWLHSLEHARRLHAKSENAVKLMLDDIEREVRSERLSRETSDGSIRQIEGLLRDLASSVQNGQSRFEKSIGVTNRSVVAVKSKVEKSQRTLAEIVNNVNERYAYAQLLALQKLSREVVTNGQNHADAYNDGSK